MMSSAESSCAELNMVALEDEDAPSAQSQEFLSQISELQEAVQTMKSAFTTAQLQLVSIGLEDQSLHDELTIAKSQCQQQSNEIIGLVFSLKSEILALREVLETTQMITHGLETRLEATLLERNVLLDELAKNGAISQQLREKLYSCHNEVGNNGNGICIAGRSSSGSQSTNDSGVALCHENKPASSLGLHLQSLLTDFNSERISTELRLQKSHSSSTSANNLNNNNGSCLFTFSPLQLLNDNLKLSSGFPGCLPTTSTTHVQSYLNTLRDHNILNGNQGSPRSQHENDNDYPSLSSNTISTTSSTSNNNHPEQTSPEGKRRERSLTYDSDSSLVVAAAKSLTLSTSLSKQCGLELDQHRSQKQEQDEKNDVKKTYYKKKNSSVIHHSYNKDSEQEENVGDANSSSDLELQQNSSVVTIKKRTHALDVDDGGIEPSDELLQNTSSKKSESKVKQNEQNFTTPAVMINKEEPKNKFELELSYEESQRLKVAKELVETERKYCHTLKTIQEVFAMPLRQSNILTVRDINTLFPEEVSLMYGKHCQLLGELEQRVDTWSPHSNIGDLLENFTRVDGSNVLRLYTCYVNDFPEVLKTFHKLCRSNGEFTTFLKQCLEKPVCGNLDLGAFLLTPVQRMPRYILLLKQMMKWTDSTHRDYENITICLNRLRDYLSKLNDSMEHSFQLVTAQIIPLQQARHSNGDLQEGVKNNGDTYSKRNSLLRSSVSSESSSTSARSFENTDDMARTGKTIHKMRYKRSASASRSQNDSSSSSWASPQNMSSKINKLKTKAKSDWAVCKMANCRNEVPTTEGARRASLCINCNKRDSYDPNFISPQHNSTKLNSTLDRHSRLERSISDSDINSDADEETVGGGGNHKYQVSKSMYDFSQSHQQQHEDCVDGFDWAISEPSLCLSDAKSSTTSAKYNGDRQQKGQSIVGRTVFRKSTVLRPCLPPPPSAPSTLNRESQLVRIERGSQPDLSQKGKKRLSLRTSLKNLFSLKKRYGKNSSGNGNKSTSTESESKYYRVVYTESSHHHQNSGFPDSISGSMRAPYFCQNCTSTIAPSAPGSRTTPVDDTATAAPLNISPLIKYLHRMPSYLELVMFSVKETTV